MDSAGFITHEPERLFELVRSEDVTVVEIVPSYLRTFLDESQPAAGSGAFGKLKWLVLGGEILSRNLPAMAVVLAAYTNGQRLWAK